ncbi:MAG: cyclic nucleotide-binding domain-containing protein [Deltaproteobacteria bacterium]|nr:cyclic nucleotide-binding domain-containing protein [Deltaproteobacteria bacterium]
MTETTRVSVQQKSPRLPKNIKILVVDSNPNHRSRLKDILRGMEMVDMVSERSSLHGLLEILIQTPAHIVVIDTNSGGDEVFESVKALRAHKAGMKSNYVLMGEGLTQDHVNKGRAAGIKAYLPKPFDIARLEKVIIAAAPPNTFEPEAVKEAPTGDPLKDTLDKLRQVTIFSGFSDTELVRLLRICKTKNFKADTKIFQEGDDGDSLYVIVAGKLQIRKVIDKKEKVLVYMKPGDCFGEMAIIESLPRMADAVAETDCTVIEVHESVVNNNEDVLSLKLVRQIAILLAKKLRSQSR